MDPERVHSYLQVACAGLGFDIGEVWWTSNQSGFSSVAAIEEKGHDCDSHVAKGNKPRFVQLYTSRSYADQRSKLVCPPSEDGEQQTVSDGNASFPALKRRNSTDDLKKHALSPQLVDAIANSTEVVWANCQKQEGLLGRSDMRLQTAVGMPVAVDENGNMCVVVMFSPNNVQSSDEAMEYLQFISRSATSSSIPCLLPVFDERHPSIAPISRSSSDGNIALQNRRDLVHHYTAQNLGEGVTARFVPLDNDPDPENGAIDSWAGLHTDHKLSEAPKDCFGIPMLPSFAELGNAASQEKPSISASPALSRSGSVASTNAGGRPGSESPISDPFDEASYGVWNTIMETAVDESLEVSTSPSTSQISLEDILLDSATDAVDSSRHSLPALMEGISKTPLISNSKRVRLEEFCSAFLGMSVFDVADVWVPSSDSFETLRHVTSVTSTRNNDNLNNFKRVSGYTQIKVWSGAVGRAYASGNPVWSANQDVIVDTGRRSAFQQASIQTALAVPIFTAGAVAPTGVLCCYSLVRTDSVPFVLGFVQKAVRLLWEGLDRVEPHESVGKKLWRDVAPADLGEMAADVEMQQAFLTKRKRPHEAMSASPDKSLARVPAVELANVRDRSSSLSYQLEALDMDNPTNALQYHLQNAVRSIGDAVRWSGHHHVATNDQGTKRAHVYSPAPSPEPDGFSLSLHQQQQAVNQTLQQTVFQPMPQPNALQVPPGQNATFMTQQPIQNQTTFAGVPYQVQSASVGAAMQQAGVTNLTASQPLTNGTAGALLFPTPAAGQEQMVFPDSVPSVSGQFCLPAAPNGTATTNGKPCRIQGCNDLAIARRPYCLRHSGNRSCEHPGCTKCAQGSTRFCIAHGGGRRCTFPGCDKGARDKFFCAAHGGGKRCSHEGCTKSAVGGSHLCTSHGGGRRCSVEGCDKSAQSSTKFCVKHGGGKKCAHANCSKVARGRTLYCASHGGGVRCKLEGCNRVAIGKLQLCRTHGGGARARTPKTTPQLSPPIMMPK